MPIRPSYTEAIRHLDNLETYGIRLGLERIHALLESLGNPQDTLHIIHVGGTNGKGSTSAMIASILITAGYKVGLYTSPHLMRFNERIRINGKEISDRKVAELVERIRRKVRSSEFVVRRGKSEQKLFTSQLPTPNSQLIAPTFFEFTTAMAFLCFAEEKVDFAVMEVGLGGRLDATNVGTPTVSIITNIAKDHEALLGKRIKDIACEKAGVIRRGGILISAETKSAAVKVLTAECKKKKAMFYRLNRDFFADGIRSCSNSSSRSNSLNGLNGLNRFCFKGRRWLYRNLTLNLLGRHQQKNAACALAALGILEEKGYDIHESAVRKGLKNIVWPGRLEIVRTRPFIILDCAHNPAGAEVLRNALQKGFTYKRLFLVLGIMADKDIQGISSRLAPLAHTVILTHPKTARAAPPDLLCREVNRYTNRIKLIENVSDACSTVLSLSKDDDLICVTGSLFTVGEARKFFSETETGKKQK